MTDVSGEGATAPASPGASRRRFLTGAGLATAAALAGCTPAEQGGSVSSPPSTAGSPAGASGTSVAVHGARQAGVTTPDPPQAQLLLVVFDLAGDPGRLLASWGTSIAALVDGSSPDLAGLDPGDLTVTVGIGPALVASVSADLPGAAELPRYGRESIPAAARGGDLMVQVCATDPLLLPLVVTALVKVGGAAVTERWRQRALRGPYVPVTPTVQAPRNVLGFVDGIVGPHTPAEQDADVWINGPAAVAGGTVMAVRRMALDLDGFLELPVQQQEAVIGRTRKDAAPLSGGTAATDPDLGAKTPDGRYLIPADAHLRRAHPLAAGVPFMLRRSYSIDDPGPGLLFVSFQNDLSTFTRTMARMDGVDALLAHTTTTAAATFLVLPGFGPDRPLGSTLFV